LVGSDRATDTKPVFAITTAAVIPGGCDSNAREICCILCIIGESVVRGGDTAVRAGEPVDTVVIEYAICDSRTGLDAIDTVSPTVFADAVREREGVGGTRVDIRRVSAAATTVPHDAVLEDAYAVIANIALETDNTPIAGRR